MNCEHGYPIRYGCLTCLSVGITVNERLEKLEKFHIEFKDCLKKDIEKINKPLSEIHQRLSKLEIENEMRKDTIGCIDSAYNDHFLHMEKRINELERRLEIHSQVLRETRLSPFKCPVCEGKVLYGSCKSCTGKGIIWG